MSSSGRILENTAGYSTFNCAFRLLFCGHGNSNAEGPMGPRSNIRLHIGALGTKGATVGGLFCPWRGGPFHSLSQVTSVSHVVIGVTLWGKAPLVLWPIELST